MRYNKTTKTIVAICLAILLFGLTVGYAVLSKNLTITGTGTVNNAGWDIHFDNVEATTTGDATYTEPIIDGTNSTTLKNYSVNLFNPEDTVTFTFDVVNNGKIDAVIGSTTIGAIAPKCQSPTATDSGYTETENDRMLCENLSISLTYEDGNVVQVNDVLKHQQSRKMKLTFGLNDTAHNIPKEDVKATNLNFSIIYVQDDSDLKN